MLDGYYWHRADFPHIYRMQLHSRRLSYILAKKSLIMAHSKLKIETRARKEKLLALKKVMKSCLQKSEVDVAANPEKLKLIGWAPRENRQPAQLPTQPTDLQITAKENQIVILKWDRPEDDQRVRNYIIENRRKNTDRFSNWTIVHISYRTQATLRNQPLGIQLEYRIRAANNAGTGPASNTVTIVL
jgi:hypothetical protein